MSAHFQGKWFNIKIVQVYAPTLDAKEAEINWFCEDLPYLLELTPKKVVLFIIGDWIAKVGSQEVPRKQANLVFEYKMKLGKSWRSSVNRTLVIGNSLFQQHKRQFYTWTSLDGQYRNQIDYLLHCQRWKSSTHSAKIRCKADCGSNHELLIAKFRLKLKKVGKTTRKTCMPVKKHQLELDME